MTETLLIDGETVRSNVNMLDLVEGIEDEYMKEYRGESIMPARETISTGDNSEILSMPARLSDDSVGMKWVSDFLDNESVPAVMGIVVYNDKETGEPLAVMDGTELTRIRTGCAAAIGSKHLLSDDPNSIGIIGLGNQSRDVLRYHGSIFEFEDVYVSDIDDEAYQSFRREFSEDYNIIRCSGSECVKKSDSVTTITPATNPIIDSVDTDVHINALGADMPEKQEVSTDVLTSSDTSLVTDNVKQSKVGGEFSSIIREGVVDSSDITQFGHVVDNESLADSISSNMTIFDSTGLAIQDVVTAKMVYENVDRSTCETFEFFQS